MSTKDFHSTAKTEFIEANNIRFAYRIFGNNSEIPLVCNKQILNRHISVKLNRHFIVETLGLYY